MHRTSILLTESEIYDTYELLKSTISGLCPGSLPNLSKDRDGKPRCLTECVYSQDRPAAGDRWSGTERAFGGNSRVYGRMTLRTKAGGQPEHRPPSFSLGMSRGGRLYVWFWMGGCPGAGRCAEAEDTALKKRDHSSQVPLGQILSWIWARAGRTKYGVFAIALARMWLALNGVLFPLVFKRVVDAATEGQGRAFLWGFVLYGGLLFLQDGLMSGLFHINQRVVFRLETNLKGCLYEGLLRTQYSSLSQHSGGELNSRLNSDVSLVANGLVNIAPGLLALLVRMGGAALVLYWWEPSFLMVYLAALVLLGAAVAVLRRPMKKLQRAMRQKYDEVQAVQQDTLNYTLMIQTFLAHDSAAAAWKHQVEGLKQAVYQQNNFSNLMHTGYAVLSDLGYLGCLLWFGAGVLKGRVSYGTLVAALQLVGQIQNPFGNLTTLFSSWFALQASAERLMELDALPKEPLRPDAPPPAMEAIEIQGLSFDYDGVPVLEDVSLEIHKGDCIGFVGGSGAGKSTLLKLLLALYSFRAGSVTVRDAQGVREPLSPATRNLFAYVPQGHSIIAGTIRQVVAFRYDKTDFTPEEQARIRHACEAACAGEFIQGLPGGYEARIGEGGVGVSEGQLQRLAIARALYYGAPILLLDEATSALDDATERRVLENIRALRDRTVLAVTHNPQALSICNRVVRVKEAKLYEETSR